MIRKAQKSDANKIIEINIKSWKKTYNKIFPAKFLNELDTKKEKSVQKCISNINEYFLYETHNHIVGFIKIGKNKKGYSNEYGEIYALYIEESYQNIKIGTKLINYALNILKEKYKYVLVSTLEKNTANDFYKKLGFQKISSAIFKLEGKEYKENLYKKEI